MTYHYSEIRDLEIKDAEAVSTSTATEHAQQAEGLMQQVRDLGRMPKESHDPNERRFARELRDARATGLMTAHEQEWRAHPLLLQAQLCSIDGCIGVGGHGHG